MEFFAWRSHPYTELRVGSLKFLNLVFSSDKIWTSSKGEVATSNRTKFTYDADIINKNCVIVLEILTDHNLFFKFWAHQIIFLK